MSNEDKRLVRIGLPRKAKDGCFQMSGVCGKEGFNKVVTVQEMHWMVDLGKFFHDRANVGENFLTVQDLGPAQ